MPAKVMVALAIVVRTARALSTVDVSPRGHRAVSNRSSTAIPTWLSTMAAAPGHRLPEVAGQETVGQRTIGAEFHRHIPERCNVSVDAAVTKELIETLEDGREGFAKGAEKLDDSDTELAAIFRRLSAQRARFLTELRELARSYGDRIDESGSVAATLHRGWMSLKDALTGSSPRGVLDAAEQGEDHAVKEYDKALGSDLSPELRAVVERQSAEVRSAHDEVRSLRDSQG